MTVVHDPLGTIPPNEPPQLYTLPPTSEPPCHRHGAIAATSGVTKPFSVRLAKNVCETGGFPK